SEDFVTLNKGALLEIAQQRELHQVAGSPNFAQWAAGVLDVEPKYIFELLQDAARIRAVSSLGDDVAQLLTRASARKVVSAVLREHGTDRAREVVEAGAAEAKAQGKTRPTAAMLSGAAKALTAPAIPSARSEISDLPGGQREQPDSVAELRGAVGALQRAHAALAPSTVKDADGERAVEVLAEVRAQFDKVAKRLTAAERSVERP
ncbi:hypothetical protein, partial [Streptomyces sp. RKND-216]|uniref:hypothetical protein n=1 Tax=Streptomyces sp. RKND-216 TaxID=2562581 RepID=UPI0014472B49